MNNEETFEMTPVTLPGAMIQFKSACSTGSHENHFGVGEMDISLHRPDQQWKWLDLGKIYYSSPTPNQHLDAQTSPKFSEGDKATSDYHRRLSKKQALLITKKITEMMMREFPDGIIPPDDEINLHS